MKMNISVIALSSLVFMGQVSMASEIILSKAIKPKLRDGINRDLEVLSNLKFTEETSEETLKVLGLEKLNSVTAKNWLETRVNYVIEENALSVYKLLVKKTVFVERKGVTFPNADIVPHALEFNAETEAEDEGVTVMSNIGAGLYMAGKKESQVYGLKISKGFLKKPIKALAESPRVGIIQIGEGLFHKELTINNENPNAISNSLNRLSTFFHEARHSDGNAKSLAFAHSRCPESHDYAGVHACDENRNGPYTVGAVMMKELIKSCGDDCSEREKEMLKIIAIDSLTRVIETNRQGNPTTDWDAQPESL
ncbi:MAG: hypothetical protein HOP07_05215 [Bacteriovoracaceae bacterium]|nr:hypothetical protein [Bacteriovoracaceae bacterium]